MTDATEATIFYHVAAAPKGNPMPLDGDTFAVVKSIMDSDCRDALVKLSADKNQAFWSVVMSSFGTEGKWNVDMVASGVHSSQMAGHHVNIMRVDYNYAYRVFNFRSGGLHDATEYPPLTPEERASIKQQREWIKSIPPEDEKEA